MTWRSFTVPRSAAIWLVYLGILVFQPAFDPASTWRTWALIGALVLAFVPLYGWTIRHVGKRPYLWRAGPGGGVGAVAVILAMIASGVAVSPFNSGASVLLVYAAATAGLIRPRRLARLLMGASFLGVVLAALVSDVPSEYRLVAFLPAAIFVPVTGLGNYYERERHDSNARLRMAQDEIERLATIAERERIARDLHDLLGHTLSTITLKAELAARLVERDGARAAAEMRDVESISRDALSQVRAAVRGYRSGGLEGELANVKLALQAAGVAYDYYLERLELPPEVESVLTLALREGVTNVVRHASASKCQVKVERADDQVVLTIEDDGQRTAAGPAADASSGGLTIMRSRVEALGGQLAFSRGRQLTGGRTRLVVLLPLKVSPRAAASNAGGGDADAASSGAASSGAGSAVTGNSDAATTGAGTA